MKPSNALPSLCKTIGLESPTIVKFLLDIDRARFVARALLCCNSIPIVLACPIPHKSLLSAFYYRDRVYSIIIGNIGNNQAFLALEYLKFL